MTGRSFALGAVLLVSANAQNPSDKVIEINEPRPLAKAALILEREYGKSISYEDVEDIFEMDSRGVLRVGIAEKGSLLGKDPSDALQSLLRMHQANGNGVFTLKKMERRIFLFQCSSEAKTTVLSRLPHLLTD